MPNRGSAAVEAHSFPKRKFQRPISRMAGMPESTRYTVMASTQPTVMSPSSRKTPWMAASRTSRLRLAFFIGLPSSHGSIRGTVSPPDGKVSFVS